MWKKKNENPLMGQKNYALNNKQKNTKISIGSNEFE